MTDAGRIHAPAPGVPLDGRVAVVAGGAGQVGEGIVRALLGAGLRVVVPSRDAARLATLRGLLEDGLAPTALERLHPVVLDVGTTAGAGELARLVESRFGAPDVVAAALGGWWQGAPLLGVDDATWERLLHDLLTAHFRLARALLPAMLRRRRGTYALVNGFSAETPYPGAAPVSIAAAAQLMLARNLMAELAGGGVRVFDLVLGPVMTRGRRRGAAGWLAAEQVGVVVAWLAAGGGDPDGAVYRLPDRAAVDALLARDAAPPDAGRAAERRP